MKSYLLLIDIFIEEIPMSDFNDEQGQKLEELHYVTFKKEEGTIDLAKLREGCLEQLPDDAAEQVEEWIDHQKSHGGAKDDTIILNDSEHDAVLHITFIEDENN